MCYIRKRNTLQNLNYWNVDLQEAYFSPIEAKERFKIKKNNFISIYCASKSIDLDFLKSFFQELLFNFLVSSNLFLKFLA